MVENGLVVWNVEMDSGICGTVVWNVDMAGGTWTCSMECGLVWWNMDL